MVDFTEQRCRNFVRRIKSTSAAIVASALLVSSAGAQEIHPLMSSKYWAKVGAFFAARDVSLSAVGSAGPDPGPATYLIDFDSETGLDDRSDLYILEFGWQFGEKWDLALQHFRSSRSSQKELAREIEWEDVVYEAGVNVNANSYMRITRLFMSRRVLDKGPHDLRVGAGVHLLDLGVSIAGEATLDDMSREFQANVLSASFPFPNIGVWYRYSSSDRWVFHARADWLSASTSDYSGRIWNATAGADYAITKHFGVGLAYEYFELSGAIKEDNWRGDVSTRFEGFMLSIDAFW
jgi:hypothetical protein